MDERQEARILAAAEELAKQGHAQVEDVNPEIIFHEDHGVALVKAWIVVYPSDVG